MFNICINGSSPVPSRVSQANYDLMLRQIGTLVTLPLPTPYLLPLPTPSRPLPTPFPPPSAPPSSQGSQLSGPVAGKWWEMYQRFIIYFQSFCFAPELGTRDNCCDNSDIILGQTNC